MILKVVADARYLRENARADYLEAERGLFERWGPTARRHLSDDDRRMLAVQGRAVGWKRLSKIAHIASVQTIRRWHRKLIGIARTKSGGKPQTSPVVEALVVKMAVENSYGTVPISINHRRILRPVLTDGLIVDLLLVDAAGNVQDHRILPVDGTLADAPAITARFPDILTLRIDAAANPSATCASCHASAHTAWAGSKHARTWDSLKPADRTDACISCHTTQTADKVLAPGVSCQACHTRSAAHVATAGTTRTTGAADCRSCHDAKHHPAFDQEKVWKVILHGREPQRSP